MPSERDFIARVFDGLEHLQLGDAHRPAMQLSDVAQVTLVQQFA